MRITEFIIHSFKYDTLLAITATILVVIFCIMSVNIWRESN
jgi:hypothetical protein